jgi:hypothetical protein
MKEIKNINRHVIYQQCDLNTYIHDCSDSLIFFVFCFSFIILFMTEIRIY